MGATELVTVRGAHAPSYVDSQCAQNLAPLRDGESAPTLVLDPKGTLVAVALARRRSEEELSLEVPSGVAATLAARLERFAIRVDATFKVAAGPDRPWFAGELERITAGIPGTAELARGLVAHGLEPVVLAACVSYTKGCYPGQELVARMQSRGAIPPYVLRRGVLEGDAMPGASVGDPHKDGILTSACPDPDSGTRWALVIVHRLDAEAETLTVGGADGGVVVLAGEPSLRFWRADAS